MLQVIKTKSLLRIGFILGISTAVLTSFGCSKKNETSQLRLQIPVLDHLNRQNSLPNQKGEIGILDAPPTDWEHIAVNVSGAGMEPSVYIWHQETDLKPESITLNVPRGENRLIEVFAIGRTEGGASETPTQFYYGEVEKNISRAIESVEITPQKLPTGNTEGKLHGRYLLPKVGAITHGPSGKVNILAKLSEKYPEKRMLIYKTSIHEGYFDFPLLNEAVPLTFQMAGGDQETLFEDWTINQTVTERSAIKIKIPEAYQHRGGGNYYKRLPQIMVLGFFGPGAKQDTNPATVSYPKVSESIPNYYSQTVPSPLPLTWEGSPLLRTTAEPPSGIGLIGIANQAIPGTYKFGGVEVPVIYSTSISNYETNIYLSLKLLPQGAPLGFKWPFRSLDESKTSLISGTIDGSQYRVKGQYLPGVRLLQVKGVGTFYRVRDDNNRPHENTRCSDLETKYGYSTGPTLDRTNPLSTTEPFQFIFQSSILPAGKDFEDLEFLVCPYNALGVYYTVESAVTAQYE